MSSLNLEGERFSGVFQAILRKDKFWGGSGTYVHTQEEFLWYYGSGIITDRITGKVYAFALETRKFEERIPATEPLQVTYSDSDWNHLNYTLEDCIVNFGQKAVVKEEGRPQVIEGQYAKIIDRSLRRIIEQVRKSKDLLPTVTPERLDLEQLTRAGYIIPAQECAAVHK